MSYPGSGRVIGRSGDDVLVYVAETAEGSVVYDGGAGYDSLRIELTGTEWASSKLQADLLGYTDFIDAAINPSGQATGQMYRFTSLALSASRFEDLVVIVDGIEVDVRNPVLDRLIVGTDGDDALYDGPGNDTLLGLGGHDFLYGGAGNDRLEGGDGDDTLEDGVGSNSFYGAAGDDTVRSVWTTQAYIDAGEGNNVVVTYEVATIAVISGAGNDVFDLQYHGSGTVDAGEGNNTINVGTGGVTYIRTGGGNDTIVAIGEATIDAGAGDDLIIANHKGTFNITSGAGTDRIQLDHFTWLNTITDFTGGAGGDVLGFHAVLPHHVTNWDGAANLFGTGHLRLIDGVGGAELQIDTDGPGADKSFERWVVLEALTAGEVMALNLDPGFAPDGSAPLGTTVSGDDADQTLRGTIGADTVTGAAGADLLIGAIGHDALDGGAGDDVLEGGHGSDSLTGGAGADVFRLSSLHGVDTIGDFDAARDVLEFHQLVHRYDPNEPGSSIRLTEEGSDTRVSFSMWADGNFRDAVLLQGVTGLALEALVVDGAIVLT